jgi:DNA polymerase-3 subunit delta
MARKPVVESDAGPALTPDTTPVLLIAGDDDFGIQQRGKQVWESWSKASDGMDHEILDGTATNSGDALKAIGRLREALATLPFFGGPKLVWLQNCTFLGEDRTASSNAVVESLAQLADAWKTFPWVGVRLLITATKPDRRRSFFKTLEKRFVVEIHAALSSEDKDWVAKAETETLRILRAAGFTIDDAALGQLVARVGPNLRLLNQELEKLTLFALGRGTITAADIEAVTARQKSAQAFALGEALGERDLSRTLRTLDEELWEIRNRTKKEKNEIGLLYGLISKIRSMILARELQRLGHIKPGIQYNALRGMLDRIPTEQMPEDRRFNPLQLHPFVLFQALRQSANYQTAELVRAMQLLLEANRKLVGSDADEARVLQQVLVEIVGVRPPVRRR